MGEIKRTQGILETIASAEPVSPAAFSLSVHDSIGGLWSLIRSIKAPMLALAPVAGSPMAALIEAAGLLAQGSYEAVTVVYYDEDSPAFYDLYIKGPDAPYALAVKLVCPGEAAQECTIRLDLQQQTLDESSPAWESPLELLALLQGKQASCVIGEPRSQWQLDSQC
ncbi:MAG: hypothetical protein ACI9JM_000627 [Halioglobus sp.]|jgi:hypothetical protein